MTIWNVPSAHAQTGHVGADSTRAVVIVGIGGGVLDVDLPDPDRPGESIGLSPRLRFDLGYEISSWFGVDAELGFTMLGGSDSLDAALEEMGLAERSAFTLVDVSAGVRGRWPLGAGRWAPFVRAHYGVATLSLSAPGTGSRETEPLWKLGGGLEVLPIRVILLRLEAQWLGQRHQDSTRNHVGVDFSVFYVFLGSRLFG